MHKERRLGWACPKTSAGVMAVWGGELQSWFGAWCYLCCNLPLTPTPPSCKLHFPQLEEEKVRAEEPQVLEYSNGASPWDVQGDSWSESGHGPPPLPVLLGPASLPTACRPGFLLPVCVSVLPPGRLLRSPSRVSVHRHTRPHERHECESPSVAKMDKAPSFGWRWVWVTDVSASKLRGSFSRNRK